MKQLSKAVILYLFFPILLLFAGCDWVDDDRSDCPEGCWLKFTYTLNMLHVDAAATQLKDVTVFIVDKDKNLVARQDIDSLTLHQNNCLIKLPSLDASAYTILVWAGLSDVHYTCTVSGLELLRDELGDQSHQLSSLFHGRLNEVHIGNEYQVIEVPLTKNTNTFSCVLQSTAQTRMSEEEFRMELTAHNGLLDHTNMPADTVATCYRPFLKRALDLDGVQIINAGLNTLRLTESDSTRFTLIHQPSGQRIFSVPLCQYILLSGEVQAKDMTPQEYLDRQDQYNLIFFLTPTENPQKPYLCVQMEVNGWMIRLNDAELE